MKLIICEKPSVAQEFAKVLGISSGRHDGYIEEGEWIITWAVGHLVTLSYPEAYDPALKQWSMDTIPFVPEKWKYEPITETRKQFDTVKKLLQRKDVEIIYNAGDAGREGEYIQRLIFQEAKPNPYAKLMRIWIDSHTDEEIRNGIQHAFPASEKDSLAASAYERAIEDWLAGINFSRACTLKYAGYIQSIIGERKAIAVGRVMTGVLGMVVEKEQQVRGFKEKFSYGIRMQDTNDSDVTADWDSCDGASAWHESPQLAKSDAFINQEDAQRLVDEFSSYGHVTVSDISRETERKKAPLLFNLAELQAECTKRFKISPAETLDIAQSLYEKKMTTYPRTDARVLSSAVAAEINKNIQGLSSLSFCHDYAEYIMGSGDWQGIGRTKYTDDTKITDHYAIIPTGQTSAISQLGDMEKAVYELIVRRFLAIFYPAAEFNHIETVFNQGNERFYASATYLKSKGFLEVYEVDEEDEKTANKKEIYEKFSRLQVGQRIEAEFGVTQKKSAKPKRYTSGSMILAMENAGKLIEDEELRAQIISNGIGTSATRASTIKKLVQIGYISQDSKSQVLQPTELGELIYTIIKNTEGRLVNPELTANWEKGLSQVEKGQITAKQYRDKLVSYIVTLTNTIKSADNDDIIKSALKDVHRIYTGQEVNVENIQNNGGKRYVEGVTCPVCGERIVSTKNGFMCEKYKEPCTFYVGEVNGTKVSETQLVKILTKGESDELTFKKKDGSGTYKNKLIVTEWNGRKIIGMKPFEKKKY